ncbi:hypothetical protein FA95DRAFT_1457673, partial [Auriscalpium vulgare]
WTTLEQLELLWEYFPAYQEHQAEKKTVDFWPVLFEAWLLRWPDSEQDKTVVTEDGEPPAIRVVSSFSCLGAWRRLKQWYNNHTRGAHSRSASGARGVIDLTGRLSRRLAPYQTYQTLYWASKLQAIVEPEWKKFLETTPGEKPSGALAFRNRRCRELLAEETDEVKHAV